MTVPSSSERVTECNIRFSSLKVGGHDPGGMDPDQRKTRQVWGCTSVIAAHDQGGTGAGRSGTQVQPAKTIIGRELGLYTNAQFPDSA